MSQFPSAPDPTWMPIGMEFLNVAASTALTIPAVPTGQRGFIDYAVILLAQTITQYVRLDGGTATAAVTGGIKLDDGDFLVVRGKKQVDNVRVIRSADGGTLTAIHYIFRGTAI